MTAKNLWLTGIGVVFLALGGVTGAQEDDQYGPAPLPEVERPPAPQLDMSEEVHDWGVVIQGDIVNHTFKVHNSGSSTLKILNVKKTCSCTADPDYTKEIAPGETGRVTLNVKTAKFRDGKKTRKHVTVTCNDPERPSFKLYMTGSVKRILEWEPSKVALTALSGKPLTGEFNLKILGDEAVELVELKARSKSVEIVEQTEIEPGKSWHFKLAAPPMKKRTTRARLVAKLKLESGRVVNIQIPVSLKNLERIQLKPRDVVSFSKRDTRALKQPGAKPLVREVTLRASDPEVSFKVTGVELRKLPEEVFSARVEEIEPGKVYKVSVTLSGELDKRFTRGKLIITTDDPSLPTKELRVFAHFDVKRKTTRK